MLIYASLYICLYILPLFPLLSELFPVRDGRSDPGLDPVALPPLPTRAPMLQQPSSSLTPPAVQWADLAAIQTQLQVQSQVCIALCNHTTTHKALLLVSLILQARARTTC